MTREEKDTCEKFLVSIADGAGKIEYIAEQVEVMEEDPGKAIGIIKDYNNRIISLADAFNEWLIHKKEKER